MYICWNLWGVAGLVFRFTLYILYVILKQMKNKLFLIIRILISFTLIGLLFWLFRGKLPDIISTVRNTDRGFLLLGFLIYLTSSIIIALRLLKVISVQGIRLDMKEATYLTFIGYFFNNFLPTSVGGDLVKAYYAGKKSNKKAAAFAGIFMDRFLAAVPLTLIPAFTLIFYSYRIDNKALIAVVYIFFFLSLVLLWLLLHRSIARYLAFVFAPFKKSIWLTRVKEGYSFLNIYSRHKAVLLWSFVLSILAQIMFIFSVYLFSRAAGIGDTALGVFFVVVPIVCIMTMLPSLNGLGIREGGFVYLLKAYMLPEKAFAISLLVLASSIVFSIIGGIIYASKKNLFSFKMEV